MRLTPYEETYKGLAQIREKMSKYEVSEPDGINMKEAKRIIRPHRCFEMAQKFVYNSSKEIRDRLTYVYGLWSKGQHEHAWIEIDNNVVYDGVLNRYYEKEGYYFYNDIAVIRKKDTDTVIKEHFGNYSASENDLLALKEYTEAHFKPISD